MPRACGVGKARSARAGRIAPNAAATTRGRFIFFIMGAIPQSPDVSQTRRHTDFRSPSFFRLPSSAFRLSSFDQPRVPQADVLEAIDVVLGLAGDLELLHVLDVEVERLVRHLGAGRRKTEGG